MAGFPMDLTAGYSRGMDRLKPQKMNPENGIRLPSVIQQKTARLCMYAELPL